MESIEQTFSDNKGNHLLVALYFYDNDYKQTSLHIPDEYAVFSFICSTEDLATNHPDQSPQSYRWNLFDRLYRRMAQKAEINTQDVIVGPDGYQSFGRAFYRDRHASIIHIVAAYLQEKQNQYQ